MAKTSSRKVIEGIHIFAGLSDRALAGLTAASRELKAEAGAVIVQEGTPGREMFLIGQGRVEVVKRAGTPREIVLATLGAGEGFGEMSLIESRTRSASIRCLEPCLFYSLKSKDLLRLFHKWPEQYSILIFNIARDLCRRLRAMDEIFAASAF